MNFGSFEAMKILRLIILVCFLTLHLFTNAQSNDSIILRYYISGGINTKTNNNNQFYDYLNDKTGFANPFYGNETVIYPDQYNYYNSLSSPNIKVGIDLNSSYNKNINHIFEAGFMNYSGKYSYALAFTENDNFDSYDIIDTTQAQYVQTHISIGYKVQPSIGHFFYSAGVNVDLNLIKVNAQRSAHVVERSYNQYTNTMSIYTTSLSKDTSINLNYLTVPLNFGFGGYIKFKQFVFMPAFYFTPCFLEGYNFYNLSLGILFDFKKHN